MAPQFIVGIGASAGGLDAFGGFFKALGPDSGMAFVVLQHLSPDHPSELASILQTSTAMKVQQVSDAPELIANCVYVIPPGKLMSAKDGHLELREPTGRERQSLIDHFFRTLAEEQGERAACIVLSGMGSDGATGLKRVKEAGGVTMAQSPSEAQFDSMPRAAISTGLVDVVGTVEELASALEDLPRYAHEVQAADPEESDALQRLFTQLRTRTGYDFSGYKRSTIMRRIKRRMMVAKLDRLPKYLAYVRQNDEEAEHLVNDFLISVTSFFRDPEAFAFMADEVVPVLFERHLDGSALRVWVPGCATGEEALSLAMLLHEHRSRLGVVNPIQIFATDIDTKALAIARQGLYPDTIAGDVSATRLERFFSKEAAGYRVKEELAETILFTQHNVLKDPPFSRVDLVSCRNLLIYFNKALQQQVFDLFNYALLKNGFLFLGSSESVDVSRGFRALSKEHRLYVRHQSTERAPRLMYGGKETSAARRGVPEQAESASDANFLGRLHQQVLLDSFAPPSVLVNHDYEVRHYQGNLGDFLQPASGTPSHQLLQMVDPDARLELRAALFQCFQDGKVVEGSPRVRAGGRLHFTVHPVAVPGEKDGTLAAVVFERAEGDTEERTEDELSDEKRNLVEHLEDENARLRLRLQTIIEEYETSTEELRASNEELQSMNEETRSLAEELETSKEELQSTNEELTTVNQELNTKMDEVARSNSDLENLMHATDIGTLFLDRNLCLKRYTPRITDLFNIIPSDLGRPFEHISHKIEYDGLAKDARRVLQRLEGVRKELCSVNGQWYLVRILPYRASEDRIDGVVLTFVDITDRKEAEEEEKQRVQQQASVAELGEYALRTDSFQDLIDLAVRQVAQGLDVPLAKVLRYDAEQDHFLLMAGVGWDEGLVGSATIDAGRRSQAGFTLFADYPVVVRNLKKERRFKGPDLLFDHDVVSGLSVVIRGPGVHPFGVLGAHTNESRVFNERDAAFMQSVANVLGSAASRYEVEKDLRVANDRFRTALAGAPITVFNQDVDHRYTWVYNPVAREEADIIGKTDDEVFEHPTDAAHVKALKQRAMDTGQSVSDEVRVQLGGEEHVFLLNIEPRIDNGEVVGTMSAAFDITEFKRVAEELRQLTAALEERVQERTAEAEQRARQVRTLASELTLAEQRERHRVAQILHDDLQQLLYSLQMKTATLRETAEDKPDAFALQMGGFNDLLLRAIATTQSLAVDLSPPVLKGEGIVQALEWLALQVDSLHNLKVNVRMEGGRGDVGSHELQVLLFRLVRELLFNIVKHAEVSEAEIVLAEADGVMTVKVMDQGKGFDPEVLEDEHRTQGGFGLYSVRERLPLFGGHLHVDSTPGEGTVAVITLPVSNGNGHHA